MTNMHSAYATIDESESPAHMIRMSEAVTLDGLFRARVEQSPEKVAYQFFDPRVDDWQTMTWLQVAEEVSRWQQALKAQNYPKGTHVAVMMDNCVHWVVFDQAALSLGLVPVPLFANDNPDNLSYIINHSEAKLLFMQGQAQADILSQCKGNLPHLTMVSLSAVEGADFDVIPVDEFLPRQPAELMFEEHDPDDLASIVYTSGTTGHPKGVMLSHKNMLWNAWAGAQMMTVYPEDIHLSFLPLSHTLERTVGYYLMMMVGAQVTYTRGIPQLAEDLQYIKPTVLVAVPRIFERVYAKVTSTLETQSAFKQWMFSKACELGMVDFESAQGRQSHNFIARLFYGLFDTLVGKKLRARLGGRLRIAIVGGAPMPPAIAKVFIGLGVPIRQGYGLTETSPVISVNTHEKNLPSSVGQLLPNVEIKIDPVTQELKVNSPGVMLGYWKKPEATAEVMENGWLHTGDVVRFDDQGFLSITGRLKDILVLSNGEKVSPADIENTLAEDSMIDQAMVIGEGRPYLSALLIMNEDFNTHGMNGEQLEDYVLNNRIKPKMSAFPGYADLYRIKIVDEPWSIENGLLTATLKVKRPKVMVKYAELVEQLYEGH